MRGSGTLGEFELVREIGRGGMGVVHLARQASLRRFVALKVLPREFTDDPVRRERFHKEAEVISRLDHESIVPVYAVGEVDGVHYIAMKFLDGETLDRVVLARRRALAHQHGRLPDAEDLEPDADSSANTLILPRTRRLVGPHAGTRHAQREAPPASSHGNSLRHGPPRPFRDSDAGFVSRALRIAERVARALQHAHSRGVVHRDVKPGNILVDGRGHPWLLDFGLVRDLSGDAITRTDNFLGTAWYMAPEQIRADRGEPDGRADIYSLGVTLYELVTLRRPFAYKSPDTLFHAIVNEEPVPPRKINPLLPRDLETVILKAMAKRPADRYQSAAAFAEDLRRVRGFEPIIARPATLPGRALRWVRRNRAVAAALMVSMICVGLLVEFTLYRDRLDATRAHAALDEGDQAFGRGEYQDALAHYRAYVHLGGREEEVASRLDLVRRATNAHGLTDSLPPDDSSAPDSTK